MGKDRHVGRCRITRDSQSRDFSFYLRLNIPIILNSFLWKLHGFDISYYYLLSVNNKEHN